jgi:hypothetical protein
MRGLKGSQRIGNNRASCTTCNQWVQAVRRNTLSRLRDRFPTEHEELRLRVELDLYPQVIDRFDREHPLSAKPTEEG